MPLTIEQLRHLEKRLHEERARALQILNGILADRSSSSEQHRTGDLTLMPLHQADLGTDTMALERLYKSPGQFGLCEDTGREIPFERLDIIPWARTC